MTALLVVQALHVLAGVVWGGGQVVMGVAVLPALSRLPPAQARAALAALGATVGPWMAASGSAVMLLGLVRGIAFGPVTSLAMVTGTWYGWTFAAALALATIGAAHGARAEQRLAGLFDGDEFHPAAGRRIAVDAVFTVALVAALVACMALMHVGL